MQMRSRVTLITTGRLDAVLHEPPPERSRHTIGRPRVGGLRLPALEQVLQDSETVWQKLTLDWYGEGERTVEIGTGTALWYRYGSDPLPIRWVLTRDPKGKRPPKAIFSTDLTQTAEQIVSDEISRWSLEMVLIPQQFSGSIQLLKRSLCYRKVTQYQQRLAVWLAI